MNLKKFKYDDFQKYVFCSYIFLIKNEKNPVENHLFFLFKTYYSPMVDYTERRKTKRKKN